MMVVTDSIQCVCSLFYVIITWNLDSFEVTVVLTLFNRMYFTDKFYILGINCIYCINFKDFTFNKLL